MGWILKGNLRDFGIADVKKARLIVTWDSKFKVNGKKPPPAKKYYYFNDRGFLVDGRNRPGLSLLTTADDYVLILEGGPKALTAQLPSPSSGTYDMVDVFSDYSDDYTPPQGPPGAGAGGGGDTAPAVTLTNATEIPTTLTGRIDLVYTEPTTVHFEAPGRTDIALSVEGFEHITWEGAVVNGSPAATGVVWASALWRDLDQTWYVLCEQSALGGSGGSGGDGLAVKMAVQEFPIMNYYVSEYGEDGWPLTYAVEPVEGSTGEGRQVDLYIEVPKEDGTVTKYYISPPVPNVWSGLSKNAFTRGVSYERTNSSWTEGMSLYINKWHMQGADYEFSVSAEWFGTDTKWVPGTKITIPKEVVPPWWPETITHQIPAPWATGRETVTLKISKFEGVSLEYGSWNPPIPPPPEGKSAWAFLGTIKGRFTNRPVIEPTP